MTFDVEKARATCGKYAGRIVKNCGCWTVADVTGDEFLEVAHPEEYLWCEVIPDCLELLPAALDRISELEAALIEERARRICHDPRADKVGHWPRYERVVVDESRQQLRSEGKI